MNNMNIQWFPGHMTKTKRMMQEDIALVDIVIELVDARIPYSSKNPEIETLAKNKKRILIMNKSDLASAEMTNQWSHYYENKGYRVILADSLTGKGVSLVTGAAKELMKEKIESQRAKGRLFVPIRAMIVGIPTVGKSTFVNKYIGKAMTRTGDKPGVTRGKQWIRVKKDLELLDTPGILWPKFEDQEVGMKLAFTGAINDDILDSETLACRLIQFLEDHTPQVLKDRYKVDWEQEKEPHQILEAIGKSRGFLLQKGQIDLVRTSKILLDEFRGGKLGRITLETPEEMEQLPDRIQQRERMQAENTKERKQNYKARINKRITK